MAIHVSGAFGDLLDPRFQKVMQNWLKELPDTVPTLFTIVPTNDRNDMRFTQVGTLPDFDEFNGTVTYPSLNQGYDTTMTPLEFVSGFQVERKLFDDDQYHIMDQKPVSLGTSYNRTRQKHAARVFVNAFSVDNYFYVNTENVALCSNSHTTTSGAATTNGFDNLGTTAMSATAVASARISMVGFRGDQAQRVDIMPDELWYPPQLYETAWEIANAGGKLDVSTNNPNVHKGKYTLREWNYMSDANDWFLGDSTLRKQSLFWQDRIGLEFAYAEDMDTLVAKWRAYVRHGFAEVDWRWTFGSQVS